MKGLNYVIAGLETVSLKIDRKLCGEGENSYAPHSKRMTRAFLIVILSGLFPMCRFHLQFSNAQ